MKQAELKKAMLAVLSRGCLKQLADDLDLSADRRSAHPREVFRPAIGCSAKPVILCHNHASGDPFKPISTTEQLAMDIQRGGGRASATSAAWLIRLATKHQKMMVDACNGEFTAYDENDQPVPKLAKLQAEIEEAARQHGCEVVFSGDPRGSTVKLILPNKESNSLDKEGWCVPTRDT